MQQRPSPGQILRRGGLATLLAAVVNLALYALGASLGAFPPTALTPVGEPLSWQAVLAMSVLGGVVGTLGYLVFTRFLARPQANRWFIGLSILVLLGMFFAPFQIENAPTLEIVLLEIMHLVSGGSLIYFLALAPAD